MCLSINPVFIGHCDRLIRHVVQPNQALGHKGNLMNEAEFDQLCNLLLTGLRDMYPHIAKGLTKRMNGKKYKSLTPGQRKVAKIKVLHASHPEVISQVLARENAAWAAEPKGYGGSFFYALELKTTFLNPYGEITGGNYRAGS